MTEETIDESESLQENKVESPVGSMDTGVSKEGSSEGSATSRANPKSTATKPKQATKSSSTPTDNSILVITGNGVKKEMSFSLSEIKAMTQATVEAYYFSKGKVPKESTNLFRGIKLYYILNDVVGLNNNAKKVTITAEDGYAVTFSLNDVKSAYIDETDPSKTLYMILAYQEDGKAYNLAEGSPIRLVMGQKIAGEYNRLNWVRNVIKIEVKAG